MGDLVRNFYELVIYKKIAYEVCRTASWLRSIKKYQAIFFVNVHEAFQKVYKALYSLAGCL